MNFLEGSLRDDAIEVSGRRFELPAGVRERLRRGEGPVLVGLRPESFKDVHLAGSDAEPVLQAEIEVAELLGHETYAYFRVPGLEAAEIGERPVELAGAMAARLDPRSNATPGQKISLGVNLHDVHLFDPESGESILGE